MAAQLLIQTYKDATVATFREASILEERVIQQIGDDLYALIDNQDRRKIILDFSSVKFLASAAIGVIMTLNQKIQGAKGTLILCALFSCLNKF